MTATQPHSPPRRDNAAGAAWMLFSVVTASAMTVAVRWASVELSPTLIVMLRAIGGLALASLAFSIAPGRLGRPRFSAPWLHVWRGALIGVSTQLGFYTISEMPLATATVLFFSAPIFAALLSIPVHGERIGLRRAVAIAAGFAGVLIVVRPGAVPVGPPVYAAIGSSFLFALALLSSRGIAERDGPLSAYLSSVAVTIVVCAPIALPVWTLPSSAWGWAAIALVVVTSMSRNIGDLQAYRMAEASVLAPLAYTRLILIAAAGYAFFDETPDRWTLAGGAVIVAAALYIAHREQLAKRR